MSGDAREQLATAQATLVRALHGRVAAPGNFNPDHLTTAASALRSKRMRELEKAWPALASALGVQFSRHFSDYDAANKRPGGMEADARLFSQWLKGRPALPDEARVELAAEAARHGFPLRVLILRNPWRPVLLLRLPNRSVRCYRSQMGAR